MVEIGTSARKGGRMVPGGYTWGRRMLIVRVEGTRALNSSGVSQTPGVKFRGELVKRSRWSLVAAGLGVVTLGLTPALLGGPALAAIDPAALGNAPDTAAGSCWEIKQV